MIYGNVGGGFRVFKDRAEYEAWIVSMREAERRRVRRQRFFTGLAIAAAAALVIALAVGVNMASAAPVRVAQEQRGLEMPKPEDEVTLEVAKQHCENAGGEWMENARSEIMIPGTKVVGCFWIVPKDMK